MFFQTVSLALYIHIDWSPSSLALLRLFGTTFASLLTLNPCLDFLGTGSSPYFSLECIFEESADHPPSVRRFSFLLLVPVGIAVLLLMFWLLFSVIDRSLSIFWQRVKNSFVAVFYISFLPICHTSFRIMNCKSINITAFEQEYVWLEDTNVVCYEGPHRKLLYYLCIPLLSLTIFFLPLCFVVFLLMHSNLGKKKHLRSWGLIFEAYKYKRRFWELVIFVRKILLAAIFAFGYHYSIRVQCLMAIGTTVFFLLAHSITSPYEKPERMLTHMETVSLFGSFIVYFTACLIHSLDSGHDVIYVLLCVVLLLILLRLLAGLFEHLTRTIDWTLGEFGREADYSKPWIVKAWIVCGLRCSFVRTRVHRAYKRWASCG